MHNYLGLLSVLGGLASPFLVFLGAAFKALNDGRQAALENASRASLDEAQADFRRVQQGEIERLMRERDFWEMAARRADEAAHGFRHTLANDRQKFGDTRPIPHVPKLEDEFTGKDLNR